MQVSTNRTFQTSEITSCVLLNLFADFGVAKKIPFVYQGHFEWNDPQQLIGGTKGDQALLLRHPTCPIDIPPVVRNLVDFTDFAKDHTISLKNINIDELIDDIEYRGRMIAGVTTTNYMVPLWMKRSVRHGIPRELIALMTLSLFIFGNTEFAFLFIFCISKYSAKTIRKDMKSIWDKSVE